MEFVATYNTGAQVGSIYNIDLDHEIVFALVDNNEWQAIGSFNKGEPRNIPSCFSPDPTILEALDKAKAEGRSHTFDME